jgi:GNAT superfamily N-acetyltransferase
LTALRIEKLRREHDTSVFSSGEESLDRFLDRHAFTNQQAGGSTTYIALSGDRIVGFHSLAVGQVLYEDAPERLAKGLARHPVPVMLLARLAVDRDWQGKGLGAGLLKDALLRTVQAADIVGIRALIVHAKNDRARLLYEHFGFQPSPTDPYHLFRLLKDIRSMIGI